MKRIDLKSSSYAEKSVASNVKKAKFEIGDHVKFESTKAFLLKPMLLIGLMKFLWLVKSKIPYHGICY